MFFIFVWFLNIECLKVFKEMKKKCLKVYIKMNREKDKYVFDWFSVGLFSEIVILVRKSCFWFMV